MNVYERARRDLRFRMVLMAALSLILNFAYGAYHGVLGIAGHSWWMTALCAYYIILGTTRFSAVWCDRKSAGEADTEFWVLRLCGVLLIALSFVLAGVNYISMKENYAVRYGTIPMITIAAYTFTKLAMAIIRAVRHGRNPSPLLAAIRRIGYAEILVSVLTLQRSMLVSFGEASDSGTKVLNVLTGTGVFLMVCGLGIQMIKESRKKEMTASKFIKANEKIAKTVVSAYEKVEETVVGGYQKVESAVVDGYAKMENAFVERYLTKEGETVEEAKARLKGDASK